MIQERERVCVCATDWLIGLAVQGLKDRVERSKE